MKWFNLYHKRRSDILHALHFHSFKFVYCTICKILVLPACVSPAVAMLGWVSPAGGNAAKGMERFTRCLSGTCRRNRAHVSPQTWLTAFFASYFIKKRNKLNHATLHLHGSQKVLKKAMYALHMDHVKVWEWLCESWEPDPATCIWTSGTFKGAGNTAPAEKGSMYIYICIYLFVCLFKDAGHLPV